MYIKRNDAGEILAVSKVALSGFIEASAADTQAIMAFMQAEKSVQQLTLEQTDQAMARVVEDLVGLLIERDVIRFTDLPDAAQTKLLSRRELRKPNQDMNLLDDEDSLNI